MITIYLALVLFGSNNACHAKLECKEGIENCKVRLTQCDISPEDGSKSKLVTAFGVQPMFCASVREKTTCTTGWPQ